MSKGTNKLAYVHTFTDRHGEVRRYFRKGSKRAPLPGKPGSAEFRGAYRAALKEPAPSQEFKPPPRFANHQEELKFWNQVMDMEMMTLSSNSHEADNASSMVDKKLAEIGLTRTDWPQRCRRYFDYRGHCSYEQTVADRAP